MRAKRNLFIGLTISALLIMVALPVKALDESLLLYLPFDSDTGRGVREITGKRKGGNIIGGTKVIPTGKYGWVFTYRGTENGERWAPGTFLRRLMNFGSGTKR